MRAGGAESIFPLVSLEGQLLLTIALLHKKTNIMMRSLALGEKRIRFYRSAARSLFASAIR